MKFSLSHISDIHFFKACLSPTQFFNRRFLGNFNYLFARKHLFDPSNAYKLIDLLEEKGIFSILISGDLTCTAYPPEFEKALFFVQELKKRKFTLYAIPGNHDIYTKKAFTTKKFYHSLEDLIDFQGDFSYNLPQHRVAGYQLCLNTYLILLDTTVFNRGIKANGFFSAEIEKNLSLLLKEIPANASIILSSHFPYDPFKVPKAHLIEGDRLESLILSDPRIKLYLHGHRHIPRIEENQTHLIIDSGSISLKNDSTYSQIEISDTLFTTTLYSQSRGPSVKKTIAR